MNVLLLQLDIAWEDKPRNYEKVDKLLRQAAPARDSLVVLPEMFATGFSMNTEAMAEPYGGETELFLARTAHDLGVWLVGGAAMRGADGRVRNKALVFSPAGDLAAFYAKMQPFTLGGEARHYVAGERPLTFDWGACKVSPFICYDLRFPEVFRLVMAAHRPHLFVVIANWPQKRIHHWERLLRARAIENQAYVVGVNRCGRDTEHVYTGRSMVVAPHGEIMAEAEDGEGWIKGKLDLAWLENYRKELPFLDDMKADWLR
jgi:omega-amidase